MRRILSTALVMVLSVAASVASPVAAQDGKDPDRSWSFHLVGEGGGMIPIRTLGKNSGDFPELFVQQVVSELDDMGQWGIALEVRHPGDIIRLKVGFSTTVGGGVSGRIGFCGDPDDPLFTGEVCEPVTTDAAVHSVHGELHFLRRAPTARIRPAIILGLGMRKYDLGNAICPPFDPSSISWRACTLLEELWVDEGGWAPGLRFGLGFDVKLGPVELRSSLLDVVGRYPGGTGTADGHGQMDLTLTAGIALRVF